MKNPSGEKITKKEGKENIKNLLKHQKQNTDLNLNIVDLFKSIAWQEMEISFIRPYNV